MSASDSPKFRLERDSLGQVPVPADRLWGAQTERCHHNFQVGSQRFRWSRTVIEALGLVKRSAARAHAQLGTLEPFKAELIERAADEVVSGQWDDEFPLGVFQSGSGTQSNMNANEVIANRAIQLAGGTLGSRTPVDPNDDVNRGQSSNDVFPTVMHVSAVLDGRRKLLPAVSELIQSLEEKEPQFMDCVMVGRTHLQDATPVTLAQVISGWRRQLEDARAAIEAALIGLLPVAIGGTAVGTGVNAPADFGAALSRELAAATGEAFVSGDNKFALMSAHDALLQLSGALRTLAAALMKLANDVRWYASGPRAGIGELILPENEPGSSIMPGKVNPTQCEMLTMVAVQVFGNDHAVAFACTQGNFQLNVYKTIILHNVLDSITLLAEACMSFNRNCVVGLRPNRERIRAHLENSLMLVTALSPHIGYERAAQIAQLAHADGLSLKEASRTLGFVTDEDFDAWVQPLHMAHQERGAPR